MSDRRANAYLAGVQISVNDARLYATFCRVMATEAEKRGDQEAWAEALRLANLMDLATQ